MEYNKLGRTGLDVSTIGLGTEYLINLPREHVVGVIHEAIAQGINYFDLFFAQPEFRNNMGAAFNRYRERVFLAAHLGAADRDGQYEKSRDPQVSEVFFLDFLTRFNTDYADVLFLHNCNPQEDYDELMKPGGLLDLACRLQREGKVRFIGLSGHNVATSLQAVESAYIDVLMFPVNLASQATLGQQGLLDTCVSHNVGLVAMKPYAGGNLLRKERTIYVEDFQMGRTEMMGAPTRFEKQVTITPVQCLSYVLSQQGVSTTVPGCKSLDELAAALAYWQATEEERDFSGVVADFQQRETGECVYCNHCLPCPSVIDVGQTISLLEMARQRLTAKLQAAYDALPVRASACIECDACTERCPFGVDVVAKMRQAVELFES